MTPTVSALTHRGRKVLLIESDGSLRFALEFLLRTDGYVVKSFASAEEFRQSIGDHLPAACLIIAQDLTGITGTTLLANLRREGHRIPTIITKCDPFSATEAALLGAEVLPVWPVRGRTLLTVVRGLIQIPLNLLEGSSA